MTPLLHHILFMKELFLNCSASGYPHFFGEIAGFTSLITDVFSQTDITLSLLFDFVHLLFTLFLSVTMPSPYLVSTVVVFFG